MGVLTWVAGADPGFQVRGEAHLIKNCAARREARKFLGYFVWKITILRQKIVLFPIAEGGAPGLHISIFIPNLLVTKSLHLYFHVHFNVLLRVNGWVEKQESGDFCPIYFVCVYIDYNYLYTTCIWFYVIRV